MTFPSIPVLLCCLPLLLAPLTADSHAAETQGTLPSLADRYRQALHVDPDNLPLHYFLGISLLTENRVDEALAEFRRAYPAYTDSLEMNYNLGLAYYLSGDPDSALLYFDQAEALGAAAHPELYPLADAYYNLGVAYLETDAHDEAIRMFSRSLTFDPKRSELHRLLGDLFARQGEVDRALQEFGAFLASFPDDRAAREYVYALHFNRAQKYLEGEEFEVARGAFTKALTASPDSPLALYYLGYLDYRQGRFEEAVERLTEAERGAADEVRRSIAAILYNCSLSLLEAGKARQALTAVTPLLEGPQPEAKAFYLAGNIHLALQEYRQAHSRYQEVLALDPKHRGAAMNLVATAAGAVDELVGQGKTFFGEGRYRQALEAFETALSINPAEPRSRSYLEEIRSELKKRSTEHFDRAEENFGAGDLRMALDRTREGRLLAPEALRGAELEERILTAMTRELDGAIEEGKALMAEDLLPEAERAFGRVLVLDPANTEARQGRERIVALRRERALEATARGDRELEEGRLSEARAAFEEALQLQPELDAGREGLAKASALLAAVVAEELQWGRLAKSGGHLVQARKHFTKALKLRDDAEVRAELAAVELAQKEKIDALLAAAERALDRSDFRRAQGYFEQVLRRAPQHSAALGGLAEVEARAADVVEELLAAANRDLAAKKFNQALEGYRQVLDLEPSNAAAQTGLNKGRARLQEELSALLADGAAAMERGRFEAAKAAFRQVLALDPYQQPARRGLDRIEQLELTGDKPGDEQRLYLRGIELYTSGLYDEAVASWERVLFLSPGHEKALMNIEKARRKLRQIKEYPGG